jgi:hypothetical protein
MGDRLRLVGEGVLHAAVPGGSRAAAGFASVAVLPGGELLSTYSVGSGKDTDDITLEQRRSADGGRSWSEPARLFDSTVDGIRGSLEIGYVTVLPDRLVCAVMWVDREAFPGAALFNPQTEGCLPMSVLITESFDAGRSWSPLRLVPTGAGVGPASLTCPVLALADGRLAVSIESNKSYLDASPWYQRVVYLWSSDLGQTWSEPVIVCADPTGRIANWDQRAAIVADGRLVSFSWTYDFISAAFRDIGRRMSADGGRTWSAPEDLGFADQPSVPAILPDGRLVLAWVDRFGTSSVRARCAVSAEAPFLQSTEAIVYEHRQAAPRAATPDDSTAAGELLADMYVWTYGAPYALALPDGDVLVTYYQGDPGAIGIAWARLTLGD